MTLVDHKGVQRIKYCLCPIMVISKYQIIQQAAAVDLLHRPRNVTCVGGIA